MNNKIKVIGILILAGFSFFYTNKVTSIIKDNDPIMKKISESKKEMLVSKVEPIIIDDKYYTGINGCLVDEEESYNKMSDASRKLGINDSASRIYKEIEKNLLALIHQEEK